MSKAVMSNNPNASCPKTRSMSHAACSWSKNSPFYTVSTLNIYTAKSFGKGDISPIVFLDTTGSSAHSTPCARLACQIKRFQAYPFRLKSGFVNPD